MKQVRCIVTGRVQGVWFRGKAKEQADRLGITGYARNLEDGSVEVLACGECSAVDQLVQWLHKGPVLARVKHVATEPVNAAAPATFSVE